MTFQMPLIITFGRKGLSTLFAAMPARARVRAHVYVERVLAAKRTQTRGAHVVALAHVRHLHVRDEVAAVEERLVARRALVTLFVVVSVYMVLQLIGF